MNNTKTLLTIDELNAVFTAFAQAKPAPKIELDYTNHYTLLVAVILSAQSTDRGVNKATPALFSLADNPKAMLQLGEEKLKSCIKSIGLYNSKARNIMLMSQQLLDLHQGQVPAQFEQLSALAGVGRKTANVMLNSAFGQHTIAVDTHVHRVSNRMGLCATTTPQQTERALLANIPAQWLQYAHHWLVLHGRYICKARKPLCEECPVKPQCRYFLTINT